ncbi:MAG: TlpA family protein disulfide reductase [Magnetococcales bacterium]|nr:TlpA family protein disulfide reductase [Magnetococcales bacterium]
MKRQLGLVLVLFVFFVSIPFNRVAAEEPTGRDMPLNTVAGEVVRISDYLGKVVLVNFWATWCDPCIEEIPELVRFQEAYEKEGFTIIGVNYMEKPNRERLSQFSKKFGINYPIVYGNPARMRKVGKSLGGVYGLPTSKLLDREGKVVRSLVGNWTMDQLEDKVKPLF